MRFEFNGNDANVSFSGDLTFADHMMFREIADRLRASTDKTIVIDVANLDFIDSAGLGMLLIAREEARKLNRTLVLRGAKGQVGRMFGLTKFDTLFSVEA
ncbi:MAG: STAS domain-containing protein [Rhodopseudomonas sp.]|uniref:STAS domain-containing protein n=1 Tax=Rhodopseudomonas sp. TaxID=1078 RepID=UPI0017AD025F|nr:STAS domain-containing protein [Rhodopseudomonas sp.]NVN84902.1 STAS domain-containing protein [Rhodopseudomonas sp.]